MLGTWQALRGLFSSSKNEALTVARKKDALALSKKVAQLEQQLADRDSMLRLYKAHLQRMRELMTGEQVLMFAADSDWQEDVAKIAEEKPIDIGDPDDDGPTRQQD